MVKVVMEVRLVFDSFHVDRYAVSSGGIKKSRQQPHLRSGAFSYVLDL